jgi:hypothetical protein
VGSVGLARADGLALLGLALDRAGPLAVAALLVGGDPLEAALPGRELFGVEDVGVAVCLHSDTVASIGPLGTGSAAPDPLRAVARVRPTEPGPARRPGRVDPSTRSATLL